MVRVGVMVRVGAMVRVGVEVRTARVAIPYLDPLLLQRRGGGVARHEPEQLLRHAAPEGRLGREQREALPQVEAHLHAKLGEGTCARAVAALHARVEHVAHQVEVLHLLVHARAAGVTGHLVRGRVRARARARARVRARVRVRVRVRGEGE